MTCKRHRFKPTRFQMKSGMYNPPYLLCFRCGYRKTEVD